MMTKGNSGLFGNAAQTGSFVSSEAPELERGEWSLLRVSWSQDSQLSTLTKRNKDTRYKWAKEPGLPLS